MGFPKISGMRGFEHGHSLGSQREKGVQRAYGEDDGVFRGERIHPLWAELMQKLDGYACSADSPFEKFRPLLHPRLLAGEVHPKDAGQKLIHR
jgi:hypothetical protein